MMDLPNLLDGTTLFMQKAGQLKHDSQQDLNQFDPLINRSLTRQLRVDLLREEYQEYVTGENENNLVEIVDGLLDTIVIAWGTLLAYVGEDKAKAAAAEVVRSNLAKVIGEGLPLFREDGKVVKPNGWISPDIAGAIGL